MARLVVAALVGSSGGCGMVAVAVMVLTGAVTSDVASARAIAVAVAVVLLVERLMVVVRV